MRERAASRPDGIGVVFRLTNHGDDSLLADLRTQERVVRPDAEPALALPLTPAQVAELRAVSSLSAIAHDQSISYAVAIEGCAGERTVSLGGTLTAVDGLRTIELVADGARGHLACDAPTPPPMGTVWVRGGGSTLAGGRARESFTDDFATMLRAASVRSADDIALLPFSYDARPIERWRYDACVSLGTCPARTIAQPPGSIAASAVGMTSAGAETFCAARSLRALTAEELAAVGDPGRALVTSDDPAVVTAGFRCARSETDAAPPP